jgi:hypothetical protein
MPRRGRMGISFPRNPRQSGVHGVNLAPALYWDLTLPSEPQGIGAVLRLRRCAAWEHRASGHVYLASRGTSRCTRKPRDDPSHREANRRNLHADFRWRRFSEPDPWGSAAVLAMGSLFAQRLIRCSCAEFIAWGFQWWPLHRLAFLNRIGL